MSYTAKNISKGVKKSWLTFMKKEFKQDYFKKILEKANRHAESSNVYPSPELVLNTFKHFDVKDTKVVLLGQDPYIRAENCKGEMVPQAMGLSFSVPQCVRVPPSLKNIYKELACDIEGFKVPKHGDISRWVTEEKVLLLNAALTVKEGKSGSHLKVWEKFTDKIIEHISETTEDVVFILLGNFAKNKAKLVDKEKHYVVKGVHPSPLSASKGFFGCKVFSKTNEYLEEEGKGAVDWTI